MKDIVHKIGGLLIRYFILLILGISGAWIFYFIFTPLTIYPTYAILNLFYDATLHYGTKTIFIFLSHLAFERIELINACIAGSAYYLLTILNLSTPKIEIKKRIKILVISFASLLLINIFRIVLLSKLVVNGSDLFGIVHSLFWYLGNIVFVLVIWFSLVRIYNIKEIPVYSDLKSLLKLRKDSFKSKKSEKNYKSRNNYSKRHK